MSSPSRLRLFHLAVIALPCPLQRAARLGEEDVVEAGLVQTEVGNADVLPIEGAHHVGEACGPAREPDGHGARLGWDLLPKLLKYTHYGVALRALSGRRLDAGASDLGLQGLRRVLGDDPAPVDDPDPVSQHVGLLEVLRRQEHGDALIAREPADLRPERAAALRVETGRRLVEEEYLWTVHQRESEVEAALHPARVTAYFPVRSVFEPDALQQLLPTPLALLPRESVQCGLEAKVLAASQEGI